MYPVNFTSWLQLGGSFSSPIPGVVKHAFHPWPLYGLQMGVALFTYKSWDDPPRSLANLTNFEKHDFEIIDSMTCQFLYWKSCCNFDINNRARSLQKLKNQTTAIIFQEFSNPNLLPKYHDFQRFHTSLSWTLQKASVSQKKRSPSVK